MSAGGAGGVGDVGGAPTSFRGRTALGVMWLGRHAWVLTAALCLVLTVLDIRGEDLAAQSYRVWLFRTHGFVIWDTSWYGGHADIGYSALFPVVGSVLGAIPAGAVACVLATVLFCRLVGPPDGLAASAVRLLFAFAVVVDLAVGRLPFAAGFTCALAALVAVKARHPWWALAAAAACSLFSPLSALFLVLAGLAWLPDIGWRRATPLLGTFVGFGVAALVGDGGVFPFAPSLLAGQLALTAACFVVAPPEQRLLRRGLVVYAVACVALFLYPNPVGGNVARLPSIVAGPLIVYLLVRVGRRGAVLLSAVLVPLLVWQVLPGEAAIAESLTNPSVDQSYYTGLLGYLVPHDAGDGRIEVVPTAQHWESTYVAERVPLARGWDRQVDLGRNDVLYHPLTAASYRSWLLANGVTYVALPLGVPLDYGARAEATLLESPPTWLVPVYHDAHWRVWRVAGAAPLVGPPATLVTVTPGGFTLHFGSAGTALVRMRWSPYWHVDHAVSVSACLAPTSTDWTEVHASSPGPVRVTAALQLDSDSRCPEPA